VRNREFVRLIYPDARSEPFHHPNFYKFIIRCYLNPRRRSEVIGAGDTVKDAWKDTVGYINKDMIRKLES
jgi:hypothetical protein